MAEIHDLGAYRVGRPPREEPPRSRNQELLAQIQAELKARDTPEARLLSELRGLEETLLGNHRRYARLWEAATQLGIYPPVRSPSEIAAQARSGVHGNGPDRRREIDRDIEP